MHSAVKDLSLDYLWIVYPREEEYPVTDEIIARLLNKILPNGGGRSWGGSAPRER